jgi:AcrR family transcriptional regulator
LNVVKMARSKRLAPPPAARARAQTRIVADAPPVKTPALATTSGGGSKPATRGMATMKGPATRKGPATMKTPATRAVTTKPQARVKTTADAPPNRRPKSAGARPYHHGALRDELIAAAEAIILERGVEGFTLREAARRAGVSPAAPAHHFGDASGLLTEVARLGFIEFEAALRAADARGGDDPARRLYEQGLAYVEFALRQPARFQLMFQNGKCDFTDPSLRRDAGGAFLVLEDAIRAVFAIAPHAPLTEAAQGALMAAWSLVHGFAHLALAGELSGAGARPGVGAGDPLRLLSLALRQLSPLTAVKPGPG